MVWRRSSAVPHSLLVVDLSCGHNWCLCYRQMGQSGGFGGLSDNVFCHSAVMLHEATQMFVMVDYLRKMTGKKSC